MILKCDLDICERSWLVLFVRSVGGQLYRVRAGDGVCASGAAAGGACDGRVILPVSSSNRAQLRCPDQPIHPQLHLRRGRTGSDSLHLIMQTLKRTQSYWAGLRNVICTLSYTTFKSLGSVGFYFIQQGHIKLITNDSIDI